MSYRRGVRAISARSISPTGAIQMHIFITLFLPQECFRRNLETPRSYPRRIAKEGPLLLMTFLDRLLYRGANKNLRRKLSKPVRIVPASRPYRLAETRTQAELRRQLRPRYPQLLGFRRQQISNGIAEHLSALRREVQFAHAGGHQLLRGGVENLDLLCAGAE